MSAAVRKTRMAAELLCFALANRLFCVLYPMEQTRVLFLSEVRDVLGGNLLCLYDALDKTRFERVVLIRDDKTKKRPFSYCIKLAKEMARSKYILLDDFFRALNFAKIRKDQQIVQLWHGAGALKNTGYLRSEGEKHKKSRFKGHKHYTFVLATSEGSRECMARSFDTDMQKVHALGSPRTDIFFDEAYVAEKKAALQERFPWMKGRKVIVFAPTYRGESVAKATYDFDRLDFDRLYDALHKEYVFVLKWHPAVYNNLQKERKVLFDEKKYPDFFYDLSGFRDINDLLLVCDVLVSDYSSVIFEYALLNKPIVHFIYDEALYQEQRGLYFDYAHYIYGAVARNCEELIEAIQSGEMKPEKRSAFIEEFVGACDGHASEKTAQKIFGQDYKG